MVAIPRTIAGGFVGVLLALTSFVAQADVPGNGAFVTSGDNVIYVNGWGVCICSSYFSEERAAGTEKCGFAGKEPEPVAYEPPLEKAPEMERTVLPAEVLFDFDKDVLKPEAQDILDGLADRIRQWTNVGRVRVVGHADRIGSDAYNDALSLRRANAVAGYLKGKSDLSALGYEVIGMGERDPIVACDGVSGRAALVKCLAPNRRVEVEVAASREKKME